MSSSFGLSSVRRSCSLDDGSDLAQEEAQLVSLRLE